MAGDRHDLMRGRAAFGEPRSCRLAQAVRGAMRQVCLTAPVLELVTKAVRRVRLAEFSHEVRQVLRRCRIEAALQIMVHRNIDIDWVAMLVLGLPVAQPPAADMLRAEAHDIFAAARGIEKKIKREPRLRPDRVFTLVPLDFFQFPRVMAG